MDYEHAQQWITIISNDLTAARRDLPGQTGEPAAFLRARIEENEAILGWLQHALFGRRASDSAAAFGPAAGEPAQAA
jgi:hypothetical protein